MTNEQKAFYFDAATGEVSRLKEDLARVTAERQNWKEWAEEARDFARTLEIETQELAGLLEDVLEFIGEPPPPNCSCHISPPCNDCVDHAEAREIDSRINAALARHRAKQEGSK